ncbi:hypothetical protein [uncultured Planktosalinus sp.]|uniref:hypothetical protein n=1 Tax=uncultured Planktosalinus sp. TaxID=1810935 RepID=UPI0030D91888
MKNYRKLIVLLLILPFLACENEPVDEIGYTTDYILVDSELYHLMKRVVEPESDEGISCIQFNYSFPIFVFDGNQEFLRVEGVNNNEEFIFLLENLEADESISLSFPMSGTTTSGDWIEINTNSELKEAIENCLKEEIIGNCNQTLCELQCAWVITAFSNTSFEGAYFRNNTDGTFNLYHTTNVYFGTWTTYFIEDQLYINMHFIDEGVVAEAFNFEWELDYSSDELMTLTAEGQTLSIGKDCELPCFEENYTLCEIEGSEGTANFALQQYVLCFGYNYGNSANHPLEFSFYETLEDAQTGSNQISSTSYNNIENPQTIYFKSLDMLTGTTTGFGSFNIEAIPCN